LPTDSNKEWIMYKYGIALTCLTIIAALAVVATSLSCSSDSKVMFKTAPFALDSSLLAPPVEVPGLDIKFSPPLGWQAADSARLEAFRGMQAASQLFDNFYPVDCRILYIDTVNNAMAYVGQINNADGSMAGVAKRYRKFLNNYMVPESITSETYRIDDLDVYFYLHRTDQLINYMLLGQTREGNKFLMEYLSGAATFPAVEGAMTSSIASLQSDAAGNPQPVE